VKDRALNADDAISRFQMRPVMILSSGTCRRGPPIKAADDILSCAVSPPEIEIPACSAPQQGRLIWSEDRASKGSNAI